MKTIPLEEFALWAKKDLAKWRMLEGAWLRHRTLGWCRLAQQSGRYFYMEDPSKRVRTFELGMLQQYFLEIGDIGVVSSTIEGGGRKYLSKNLRKGCVYSRTQLKDRLMVSNVEIKKKVARPSGANSILIFVPTEPKRSGSSSRGLVEPFEWEIDPSNRLMKPILHHEASGDELLAFEQDLDAPKTAWEFLFRGQVRCAGRVHDKPNSLLMAPQGERLPAGPRAPSASRPALSIDELRAKLTVALLR
jgi:hypothetical protein